MRRLPDLSAKLEFALKRATLSKGRLAAQAGVDKSLVGRWARGLVVPSEHNLTRVTQILARHFPGLDLTSWELSMDAFVQALGGALPSASAPAPTRDEAAESRRFLARAAAESAATVQRERQNCLGVYLGFRHGLSMGGRLICDLYVIWREGDGLAFRQLGLFFAHGGPTFILRSQVYLMGEDLGVVNGIFFAIMVGVLGQRAMRMDGVMLTIAGSHRLNSPSSTTLVMQRIADLPDGDRCPDDAVLDRLIQRIRIIVDRPQFRSLIAPEILAAIKAPVAVEHPDGTRESTLWVPTERSLGRSDVECTEAIARYIQDLRGVFLAEDAALLPMAPLAAVPGVEF